MLGHRSGPADQFRKNQSGGCGTDIYTYIYIYIYDKYIHVRSRLYTGCVVLPGKFTNRGSVAGKGGVAQIAAHSSPTGLREAALLKTVL